MNRRNRAEDKKAAISYVERVYDVVVSDDVAEAIMIGKYRTELSGRDEVKDLF